MFKRFTLGLAGLAGVVLALALTAAPASAQATRTWVSGVGDDANPCSRTAPCKTFAGAISKTAEDGEINCLDPAGFGAVTITKSITLDCTNTTGGILSSGQSAVIVNITNGADVAKTVRLRGLLIDGAQTGLYGVRILAANAVFIEDSAIFGIGATGGGGLGNAISDTRSSPGALYVTNTTIGNNSGVGINVAATAATNIAVLSNVTVEKNNYGLAIGNGNNVTVRNSVFSGNATGGVVIDGGAKLLLTRSTVTNNSTGIIVTGATALSDNEISFNSIGFDGAPATSYGNNRIFGNSVTGPLPTLTSQQ